MVITRTAASAWWVAYDPIKDFAPITQMVSVPLVLVMNNDAAARLKIATLDDLIVYGRKNPGRLNFGSAGNGSPGHLAAEMLKLEGRFSAVHIPYSGGNPAQLALLSGQVDCNFDNLGSAAANIAANKVKLLAVTSPRRLPAFPNVPAVAETIRGFSIETWWGLAAPAGTPAQTIGKLNHAFVAALQSADAKKRYAALLIEPVSSTPEEFGQLIRSELGKYEKFIKASGIRLE
jgi:tripartite-type tricarboxylate transporter receptor subunit TctC